MVARTGAPPPSGPLRESRAPHHHTSTGALPRAPVSAHTSNRPRPAMNKPSHTLLPLLLAAGFSASCNDANDHDGEGGGHGHVHAAQFGGKVVELGDHFANLEVVHDGESGELRIFTMDGHNEKTVKSSTEAITVTVEAGDASFDLELPANVSASMGNEAGASALFEITDERLVGVEEAHLSVASIEVRGKTWEDVEIHLGHDDDHGGEGHDDGDEDHGEGHDDGDEDHGEGHDGEDGDSR